MTITHERASSTAAPRKRAQDSLPTEPPPQELAASDEPLYEATAARAYELYLARGGKHGRDLDDWLQAEAEIQEGARWER